MWTNPFLGKDSRGNDLIETNFEDAQAYVNFVILKPSCLPADTNISTVSVRRETPAIRSSIRFQVEGKNRTFRVKQFFYDWAIPGIYADTNLVGQGKPFFVNGIAGFIGKDYKGNDAASLARWFTQVEISILKGDFTETELIRFCEGLVPAVEEAIALIGEQPFARTSHTARFHVPRWSTTDAINRVNWQTPDKIEYGHLPNGLLTPPLTYHTYVWDSVGSYVHSDAPEYQFLLRDKNNHTDCIWVWCAPKSLNSPFPENFGENVGQRTKWNIEKISVTEREVPLILSEQAASVPGWQLHWEQERYDYHIHIRANNKLARTQVINLAEQMLQKRV